MIYVTKSFLQQRYPTEGFATGVSDVFIPDFSNDVLQKRINGINSRNGPLVIGLIGYLGAKHKGVQVAIEAIAKVKNHLPNTKLLSRVLLILPCPRYNRLSIKFLCQLPASFYIIKRLIQLFY